MKTIAPNVIDSIQQICRNAIQQDIFPGIEVLFAQSDRILFHHAFGNFSKEADSRPLSINALFDLASLTKPIATATAVLQLVDRGLIKLQQSARELLPDFPDARITIHHLLTHTSGLPAWAPLYAQGFDKTVGWGELLKIKPIHPPQKKMEYSCLGYILLGEIVRRVSGESLSAYCRDNIFLPLGLNRMGFNPDSTQSDIVPTAYCPHRKQALVGVVHDENAAVFDGEGGNAGLFGTAAELHRFSQLFFSGGKLPGKTVLSGKMMEQMTRNQNPSFLEPRTTGWDFNPETAPYKSCGGRMPTGSIGHLGFTGTSLWLDPVSEVVVVILSNRVNISREKNIPQMRAFRPKLHDLLLSAR